MKPAINNADSVPSGIILFNKKPGITSFKALNEIKRSLGTSKVGHTGTLDKFASGLLVVLVGKALKLSKWFSHLDKQYTAAVHFGIETDTLDPEGNKTAQAPVPTREKVEQVFASFTGGIMQEPPAYSAIHINGKRASDLARSGKTPDMKKRAVSVYKLELRSWQPPYAEIFVHCSSGTYIRSLARDIAIAAGSRAYLASLVRTQAGHFSLEAAVEAVTGENILPADKSIFSALNLPWFEISSNEAKNIFQGKPLLNLLEGKPLLGLSAAAETASNIEAGVFCGGELAAVINKTDNIWKYNCVLT